MIDTVGDYTTYKFSIVPWVLTGTTYRSIEINPISLYIYWEKNDWLINMVLNVRFIIFLVFWLSIKIEPMDISFYTGNMYMIRICTYSWWMFPSERKDNWKKTIWSLWFIYCWFKSSEAVSITSRTIVKKIIVLLRGKTPRVCNQTKIQEKLYSVCP